MSVNVLTDDQKLSKVELMKTLVFATALSFAAFGCSKGDQCTKAINHGMELSKASMGVDDKMAAMMTDLGMQHCKDDKWSDDALTCMIDAKTETEAQACYGKLSPEQQQKMNKAAMDLAKPADTGSAK
jgi:hypothetical protein